MNTQSSSHPPSRCWAEVDREVLRHNAEVCAALAGPGCGIMAIVKADAYGHGLPEVVAALADRVAAFGVANLVEARRVREAAGDRLRQCLVLGPAAPDEIGPIVAEGFSGSVSQPEEVATYGEAAAQAGTRARLHAVADTGMGRIGAAVEGFPELVEAIRRHPHCDLEGLATHFPSADEDRDYTLDQIGRFKALVGSVGPEPGCQIHLANSAGLIGYASGMPFATMARPGLALYGVSPMPEMGTDLRPAMSVKTRVTLVRKVPAGTGISYGRTFVTDRPTVVATLAAGYGDGYPRHLSGSGAEVLVGGRRCPLLGRVTMDQVMVDVSGVAEVRAGDEAVLIGRQGDEEITASEVARLAGTIPWEVLTGITGRVVRVYC